ncbi:hypothetical protein GPJ56_006920 [Histomonas meleagridis]|uniref:uncharacterized protein n=1 Tax=Histomonas meleagridis TaxID=135588 RepID=UPI00355A2726|nr:hypothetical protein GPJ56_006920 [Histomonas meleagridis]KAH0800287.1 hypothetical protein GO595_006876 [Histomonas meleagridis]
MTSESKITQFLEMFPDKDEALIRELVKECRDDDEVIERLQNKDSSTMWKKPKSKKAQPENAQNKRRGPQRPRGEGQKSRNNQKEEKIRKITSKPKPVVMGQSSGAGWGDIIVNNNEIVTPEAPAVEEPKEVLPPVTNTHIAKAEPKTSNEQKQIQIKANKDEPAPKEEKPTSPAPAAVKPPTETVPQQQIPSASPTPKPTPTRLQNTVLYLPSEISKITPDYKRFGIFAGPIPKPAPPVKPLPQIADTPSSFEEIEVPQPHPMPADDSKSDNKNEHHPPEQHYGPQPMGPILYPYFVPQMQYSQLGEHPPGFICVYPQMPQGQENNAQRPMAFKSVNEEPGAQQQQVMFQPVYGLPQSYPTQIPQGQFFVPVQPASQRK